MRVPAQDGRDFHFFGIENDKQASLNYPEFKKKLIEKLGFKHDKKIIQVVGDSARFSEEGTTFTKKILNPQLADDILIEYGFTGYKTGAKELDINSFVNEYVDNNPEKANQILANIVGHTVYAIKEWGCYVSPHIRNFVVVYNQDGMTKKPEYDKRAYQIGGFTTFGAVVPTSDNLLQTSDGDEFYCVEGVVHSFRQVANSLKNSIPITLVLNVRKKEKEMFFSAARFFHQVSKALEENPELSPQGVHSLLEEYKKSLHAIWDESKADYKTKKEQFDTTIDSFMQEHYKQVPKFCTFIDAKNKTG